MYVPLCVPLYVPLCVPLYVPLCVPLYVPLCVPLYVPLCYRYLGIMDKCPDYQGVLIEVIRSCHFKLVTVTRYHVFEAKINGTHAIVHN